MSVFVTVGSTSFDDLISTVCSSDILDLLSSKGFKKIVLQIGRGSVLPEENSLIKIEWFRFKENISEDIKSASLIIGHGGAGTILECLLEKKPFIAVLNEKLMNNHQSELAEKLSEEGFLVYSSCSKLLDSLKQYFSTEFKIPPFISEPYMFPAFLEEVLGLG